MTNNIKKYDFKEGLPQEFEIVDFDTMFSTFREELTTTHRVGFYHILWFQDGSPEHLVDFKPVKLKPNSLLFIGKDSVQRFDLNTVLKGKAILFTDDFFCKTEADTKFLRSSILYNDLFSVSKIQLPPSSAPFAEILGQMEAELQKPKDYYQSDILRNLLRTWLLQAERERRQQDFTEIKKGADLDYVMEFKTLLDLKYKSLKQVGGYAEQMHITDKRLNQAISKVLGKTPKQMIDGRVMLEAKRLLAHTSQSVKEIGFELGFEEPTNFIKYFKKHHSSTPIEFRAGFST